MTEEFAKIQDILVSMVTDTAAGIISFLPKLIGAIAILLIGWLIAKLLRSVLQRSIRGGLDALLERTGAQQAFERTSMTSTPSEILGSVVYWLVMILFLMAASRVIGLDAVSDAITRILAYVPSVISAALILAAGVLLSRFVGNVVTSAGAAANLSYAKGLGAVANTGIVVMVGVVTLEQLGVDTQILITVITVVVAAITAGMGLAFALGARGVVSSILAGHYLRQTLPAGAQLEVAGQSGVLEQIGPISTTLRGEGRSWSVPNRRMMEEIIGL